MQQSGFSRYYIKAIPAILVVTAFLCASTLCAQTAQSVEFTSVPAWGQTTKLQGRVHNANPQNYGIAVCIFVEEAGGWWTKPLASQPVTAIKTDSTFSADIVTGGLDQFATRIIAFLIPLSYTPPALSGGELPDTLRSFPFALECRPHGDRKISWSGFEWTVKRSVGPGPLPMGPGPNIFNDHDSMVWVDNQHNLHLRIAANGSKWHCTELICNTSQGYARYNFQLATRIDLLDPNIIAGIFTWDDGSIYATPPDLNYREIDLEFSRWAIPGNDNSQYVIQPWQLTGNTHRFNMISDSTVYSRHFFDWSKDSLFFKSTWGNQFHAWTYRNPAGIPVPGNETIRINFHLLFGNPPSDGKDAEFILGSFALGNPPVERPATRVKIFPNPVVDGCTIEVSGEEVKNRSIELLDLQGNVILSIINGKPLSGTTRFQWDGTAADRTRLPAGIYLLKISDELTISVLKVVKL